MPDGICKLTGKSGKLVRSHLIPRALTKPEEPGRPLFQAGSGRRPIRRQTSWYDPNLVTAEGEALLSALDDWAIAFLRQKKLVWSGWGPMQALGEMHTVIPRTPYGIRKIKVEDPGRLRLFFLSLAWRAAASTIEDFNDVILPDENVERLRHMVESGRAEPLEFYPILLTQLSTFGLIHNQSPFLDEKVVPPIDAEASRVVPMLRFYFDGLIAHVHLSDDDPIDRTGNMAVGASSELIVPTIRYEDSFQRENITGIMAEAAMFPYEQQRKQRPPAK